MLWLQVFPDTESRIALHHLSDYICYCNAGLAVVPHLISSLTVVYFIIPAVPLNIFLMIILPLFNLLVSSSYHHSSKTAGNISARSKSRQAISYMKKLTPILLPVLLATLQVAGIPDNCPYQVCVLSFINTHIRQVK